MRTFARAHEFCGLFLALAFVCGCGGNGTVGDNCNLSTEITVAPTSATVNHAAAPPANQVQFVGSAAPTAPPGCPIPAWVAIVYGTWSNPDPDDIQISSVDNSTNGTAVCLAPTNGAVTLTGSFTQIVSSPVTKSVQLTCD
ncbi:MAG: hypothetical protein WB341_16295 [Terracidiphilus sp.]